VEEPHAVEMAGHLVALMRPPGYGHMAG